MKILVTGSEGFVGRHTTTYFRAHRYEIIPFDVKRGEDTRDRVKVEDIIRSTKPDYILHLAWIVDKRRADRNPYESFEVGLLGTMNLLEAASSHGVKRFLFMNSSQAYGNSSGEVSEASPFRPENCYARSKVAALYLLEQYASSRQLSYCVATSWELFGEGAPHETIVMRLIKKATKDEDIVLYCYGKQRFDLNYVENVCRAYELALLRPEAHREIFNVGSGIVVTLEELARMIVNMSGSRSKIRLEPPREGEVLWNSYPRLDKIRSLLGYEPLVSLEEGLKRTLNSVRET